MAATLVSTGARTIVERHPGPVVQLVWMARASRAWRGPPDRVSLSVSVGHDQIRATARLYELAAEVRPARSAGRTTR